MYVCIYVWESNNKNKARIDGWTKTMAVWFCQLDTMDDNHQQAPWRCLVFLLPSFTRLSYHGTSPTAFHVSNFPALLPYLFHALRHSTTCRYCAPKQPVLWCVLSLSLIAACAVLRTVYRCVHVYTWCSDIHVSGGGVHYAKLLE